MAWLEQAYRRMLGRILVALLSAILLATGAIPPAAAVAAQPEATTPPPAQPGGNGDLDPRDGRVVSRPPIDLGISGTDGAAAGAAVTGPESLDPSILLRPKLPGKKPPAVETDVRELWTERTRTVANPDGTYTLSASGGRLNFKDSNGDWQKIDLSLITDQNGKYDLKVKANDRAVSFGQWDASLGLAQLSTSKGTIALRALDFPSTLVKGGPAGDGPAAAPSASPSISPTPSAAPSASPSATPEPAASGSNAPTPTPDSAELPQASTSPSASAGPTPVATASAVAAATASAAPTEAAASASAAPTEGAASAEPGSQPPERTYTETKLHFSKDDGSGEVVVLPTDEGFQFQVVLANPVQASTYAFALDLEGLQASLASDGQTILLWNGAPGEETETDRIAGFISAPVLLDADEVPAPAETTQVSLVIPGQDALPQNLLSGDAVASLAPSEVIISYAIDPAWLAAPDRAFPVTLDPSACLGEGASGCDINGTGVNLDHFVLSGRPDEYPVGWTVMRVGRISADYDRMRGIVYFGDVALPDGAVVYDTNLRLHVSSLLGGASGKVINLHRVNKLWDQGTTWNEWNAGAGYDSAVTTTATIPASGNMNFDADAIVQQWYTRRTKDWKQNIGFALKQATETDANGVAQFDRYNDATASYRPLLTISYAIPKVSIDFDAKLGPNYAPSTMIAGQPTTLPIRVTNNGTVAADAFLVADWFVGYRWFDHKNALLSSGQQSLPGCVGIGTGCTNPSAVFGLNVTPPTAVGQYTLRLDLIRNGTPADPYASDWARPSLFYSRNKKALSADNTRWTGSSLIERDEFSIGVVGGSGGVGDVKSVETGDGGELGIDLWSKNLSYSGAGGVGFDDLVPMDLDYTYDSKEATDCTGILDACGWSTNWDERFIPGTAGRYTYVDPSGNRFLTDTDGDQQLVGGAPVLLSRPRTTFFDENVPSNTPTAALVTPTGFSAFTGSYSVKVPANVATVSLGTVPATNLNAYTTLRFAARTSTAASAGIGFTIKNTTKNTSKVLVYTLGTTWATGQTQIDGGQVINTDWRVYGSNLYSAVRNNTAFGGPYDDYEVTAITAYNRPGMTGDVYFDAVRLEAAETSISNGTSPNWSANGSLTSILTGDAATGSTSLKVLAAPIASSPDCHTTLPSPTPCWSTSAGGLWSFGFASWEWKKVGGASAAIVFHLKDVRTNVTGDLTYYAGPTAPVGAVNAIQVSASTPVGWSKVTRNLLQDARQVLNFFNDSPTGASPLAPPSQGPSPDDVRLTGFRISATDGNFLLIDDLAYSSLPDVATDTLTHPSSTTDATFVYDFTAAYSDGSVHYFNSLGLLERIADRDGNLVNLDWSLPSLTVPGPNAYRLDRIHAASDAHVSGAWTYDRELVLSYATGTDRTVTFTEQLGTTAAPITGRKTVFSMSTTNNDLLTVRPARTPACAAVGTPSGCATFSYTDATNHLLKFIGDPRWDRTATSGAGDLRFEVTWAGTAPNQYPTTISDRSQPAPLLRVLSFATGSALPAATRVAWQDDAALRANDAIYADITSDGKPIYSYIPLPCGAADCATLPTTTSLASQRAKESQFDGLARESTSIQYRCPGVAVSGCTGTAEKLVSRQGTKAGAKVDNYNDPLTGGQTAWTQSPDQHVSSLRDSAGEDPDLYRTFYTYDHNGQQSAQSRPAYSGRVDYDSAIKSTTQFSWSLKGFWRLGDSSASAIAIDSAPSPNHGNYVGGVLREQPGALINNGSKAASFDGIDDRVAIGTGFGTVAGTFSVEAWVRPGSATTTMAYIGSRKSNTATTDYTFDAKLYYTGGRRYVRVDVGNGSSWLLNGSLPYDYAVDEWAHIVTVIDDAKDRATVYVDGQPIGVLAFTTAGQPLLADATRLLRIGNNGRDSISPESFNGDIDEVAVYTVGLTAPQVLNHYLTGHSIGVGTVKTLRDRSWRPIQIDDQFMASPGFESGLVDWDFGSGAVGTVYTATTLSDPNVHQPADPTLPPSWASYKTGLTGNAQQDAQLVPGQTVRVQVWHKSVGAAAARINLYYWQRSTASWQALVNVAYTDTAWTGRAWDVTLPFDTDGRIRMALWVMGGTGTDTVYFDDAAVLTTYGRTTYTATPTDPFNGLVRDTITFSPTQSGPISEFLGRNAYEASATTPPIFETTSTSNYQDGVFTPASPDIDVSTTATFDAWGHQLTTTDQDGVAQTTAYVTSASANGFATDVASTKDGLNNTTTFAYDLVGNQTQETTPGLETTTTTYDLRNHELTVTDPAPISTVTKNVHDAYGFKTSTIENFVDGTPTASGLDDVITTYGYDEFGALTSTTANTGVSSSVQSRTTSLHDLIGNEVSSTEFSTFDGTNFGGARTTTQHVEVAFGAARPKPSATRGPGSFAPTGGTAPICPDGSALRCNNVEILDQNGQAISATDAYGTVTRTFRDFAGRAATTVLNYGDGIFDPAAPAVDLVTARQFDLFGRPAVEFDTVNRKIESTFDALGRQTKSIVYGWNGTASVSINETRTVYTGAGRVDRVSLPGSVGAADTSLSWTKSVYDAAGRKAKTIANFDTTGGAQLQITPFETGLAEGFSTVANLFVAPGATTSLVQPASTGTFSYQMATSSATKNQGASRTLSGTFSAGRTYKAVLYAQGSTAGQNWGVYLGSPAASDFGSLNAVSTGSGWQRLEVTWIPTATYTSGIVIAFRANREEFLANTARIDDVSVFDAATPDRNIPTETVYDADDDVVASIQPGGSAGDPSMVTRSAYDALGRITSVTVNQISGAGTAAPDVNLATVTTYDALGRVATETDPTSTVTKNGYDRLDNLTSTTQNYLDGTASGPYTDDDVTSRFGYNAAGEMTGYCSPVQVYAGGCIETGAGNAQAWRYAFDDDGNVVTQTPPVNTTAAPLASALFVYDVGGRLVKTCDGPAGTTSCTAAGVLRTTTYTHDPAGRTTSAKTYTGPGTTLALQTDTTFFGDGQPAQTKYSTGAAPTVVDTIDYVYDSGGRQTKVMDGATVLSEQSFNPNGTVAWRRDGNNNAIGQTNFTYDWAHRPLSIDLPDTYSISIPNFTWRNDGLVASRAWSGSSATFSYDGAKRPIQIAKGGLTQTQTYDRDGNVTSEGRTFTGITGDAGAGTQSFTYDALNRVTSSSGLASGIRTYTYDRDSNRMRKVHGGVAFDYVYDRTDQLVSVTKAGSLIQNFSYDAFGNMTGDAQTGAAVAAMTYDLFDKMTGIDAAGTANDATFTFDALGRFATRILAAADGTDTYSYIDTSETVVRIANSVAGTTDSISSSTGDRLGVKVGTTVNWFLPDLHGNIAGSLDAAEATVVNAIRYDAYGETLITGTAGGTAVGDEHWKYQGRLDVSPAGLATPLYDMSARFYNPGIGAFTQLDSVMGTAQNPITMNRFLYAGANPTTLVDPTGHWFENFDPLGFAGQVASNAGNFGIGVVEGAVGTAVDAGAAIVQTTIAAGGCAIKDSCRRDAASSIQKAAVAFSRDPARALGNASKAIVKGAGDAIGSAAKRVGTAWSTGNFRELGKVTGEVAVTFVPVGGMVAKSGQALKGLAGSSRFMRGAKELAGASRAGRAGLTDLAEGLAIQAKLQYHAIRSSFRVKLTTPQKLAADKNKNLRPMFRGERVDFAMRKRIRDDDWLNKRISVAPRRLPKGTHMPDYRRVHPGRSRPSWYDLTRGGRTWTRHKALYRPFGQGRRIRYLPSGRLR